MRRSAARTGRPGGFEEPRGPTAVAHWPFLLLSLCIIVFAARAVDSLRQDSATFDETNYLGIGRHLMQTGRWDVPGSILHPPGFFYLTSLPLLTAPIDADTWRADPARSRDRRYLAGGDIPRGQALLAHESNAGDRLLTRVRMTSVVLGIVLILAVFAWTKQLFGSGAAVLASVVASSCPTILAHSRLATPDIGLTTFGFLAAYGWWRMHQSGSRGDAVASGAMLGMALLFKFTALLLVPVLWGLTLWWRWRTGQSRWSHVIAATGIAGILLVIGYQGNLSAFWDGLVVQRELANEGHPSFLMGEVSRDGWWYYLILAFYLKTPLGILLLMLLGGAAAMRGWRMRADWFGRACLFAPVAVLVVYFSIDFRSIGLRYLLPIFPFLFVLAGYAFGASPSRWRNRVVIGLAAWAVAASLWVHPHYLAYFHELAGGPANGHRLLVDSNLDWGQDLKKLKQFMDANGIKRVSLSYFGTDDPHRFGINYTWLPSVMLRNPHATPVPHDPADWYAISATNLHGVYFAPPNPFTLFQSRTPDAIVGYSILMFRGGR